jgi:hypothetical protein
MAGMGSTPGHFQCENRATTHLWVVHRTLGDNSAFACDEHTGDARQSGHVLDEHPFGGCCGLPGTIWDFDNHLCFIDDSGVEAAAKSTERVGV